VIAERINRRRRNRVHRVRADQLFDIHDVPIFWILGAWCWPKAAVASEAPLAARLSKRGAAEQLLILLVGELGVGDKPPCREAFEQLLLTGVRRGLEFFVDLAINKSVYAADKKARHAGNVADVLALRNASFESGKECFGDFARKRTAQRAA